MHSFLDLKFVYKMSTTCFQNAHHARTDIYHRTPPLQDPLSNLPCTPDTAKILGHFWNVPADTGMRPEHQDTAGTSKLKLLRSIHGRLGTSERRGAMVYVSSGSIHPASSHVPACDLCTHKPPNLHSSRGSYPSNNPNTSICFPVSKTVKNSKKCQKLLLL